MATRELARSLKPAVSLAPAFYKLATDNGTVVDTLGFESVTVVVSVGAISDATHQVHVEMGDHSNGDDMADVPVVERIYSTLPVSPTDPMTPANISAATTYKMGVVTMKRYIRVVHTGAATTGVALSAVVVLGHPHEPPIA